MAVRLAKNLAKKIYDKFTEHIRF